MGLRDRGRQALTEERAEGESEKRGDDQGRMDDGLNRGNNTFFMILNLSLKYVLTYHQAPSQA